MSNRERDYQVIPGRPPYWSRQYIEPFVLDIDDVWRIIKTSDLAAGSWVTRSNEPVVTLLHYLWMDGYITVSTTTNRAKYKAWRRNPAASFCIWDPENPFKQVTLRGRVEVLPTDEYHRRWCMALIDRRFSHDDPERQFAMFDSPDRRYLRLNIERILSYDGVKQYDAESRGLDVWAEEVAADEP